MPVSSVSSPTLDLAAPEKTTRTVTAEIAGGGIKSSTVKSEGDKEAFKADTLGKDDFLSLLITSLRYQDPLNPADNQQFIAQMAQFTSLETSKNMQTSLEKVGADIASMVESQKLASNSYAASSATSMLGKTARIDAADFPWSGSGQVEMDVSLDAGVKRAVAAIYNAKSELVTEVEVTVPDPKNPETAVMDWNGTNSQGMPMPSGTYTVKIMNPGTENEVGYAYLEGQVTGISYTPEGVMVEIGGQRRPLADIVHVTSGQTELDTLAELLGGGAK